MAGDSGQKFIRRNRPPRVHITYEDPYNAEQKVELPFVMGVMADLSGNASGVEKAEISQRKFLDFDMDNFDQRMAAIEPGIAFNVPNKLGDGGDKLSVALKFSKFDDFNPAHASPTRTRTSPSKTCLPVMAFTSCTLPARSDSRVYSIFIASITTRAWPFST